MYDQQLDLNVHVADKIVSLAIYKTTIHSSHLIQPLYYFFEIQRYFQQKNLQNTNSI